jgi:hypothetical protein
VAFFGRHAIWVYYTDPTIAIEAVTGLTDTVIAHQPLVERGRPGHEKPATTEYLLKRGVHFIYRTSIPKRQVSDRLRAVRFGDFEVLMLTYDQKLMDALGEDSAVHFVNFPRFLDSVFSSPTVMPRKPAQEMLAFSKQFYFEHNDDPERLEKLVKLSEADGHLKKVP